MLKVIIIAGVPVLTLAVFAVTENLFVLFLGLWIICAYLFILYLKKYSFYLLFAHLLLLAILLFIINSIDFDPNYLDVDYFNDKDYTATLEQNSAAASEESEELTIVFEKNPFMEGKDLVLADYRKENDSVEASWRRAEDAPREINGNLKYVVLKSPNRFDPDHYEVNINDEVLTFNKTENDRHYFTTTKNINRIMEIRIKESRKEPPLSLDALEPPISMLYLLEDTPAPMVIEAIAFQIYFGRMDKQLPFHSWDASALKDDFHLTGGEYFIKNDLLHILPADVISALHYTGSRENIYAAGLGFYQAQVLAANIAITALMLLLFIGSSILLNSKGNALINFFKKLRTFINQKKSQVLAKEEFRHITPFKVFFFFFALYFLLSIFIFFSIEHGILTGIFISIIFMLGLILITFVVKAIGRLTG